MSQEIKCPKCGEIFKIDENNYNSIAAQVRDSEFEKEVSRRVDEKCSNIERKAELDIRQEISKLQINLDNLKAENERLKASLKDSEEQKNNAISLATAEKTTQLELLKKDMQFKIAEYENIIKLKESQSRSEREQIESKYKEKLKEEEEKVNYYKDLKTRMSTKLLGETLEQHCQNAFNSIRATAYPYAIFTKDNEVSRQSGSKGDFIFRDYDSPVRENEIVSIMFEMKNEMDTTATKHKNSDFFKELDKDRKEKKCEYAVLVSMLESDSELYNSGIVDVSYEYEKMFVVRPQCFLTIIALLRSAGRNALEYKSELAVIKRREIDVTNFEEKLMDFQERFGKNYKTASDKFNTAIDEIDKTISHLLKVKESLVSSENQLRLANEKAQDLSIKKLTRSNPTMKKKFEEAKKE